ncbi:912_t:CDS:1, partial [Gigaspora rosea]
EDLRNAMKKIVYYYNTKLEWVPKFLEEQGECLVGLRMSEENGTEGLYRSLSPRPSIIRHSSSSW